MNMTTKGKCSKCDKMRLLIDLNKEDVCKNCLLNEIENLMDYLSGIN